jgi:beta-glucosidase
VAHRAIGLPAGAVALRAGVDVSLWDTGFSKLGEAVQKGYVSEQELNEAVLRVLKLKFERGLFEHPYLDENLVSEEFTYQNYPQSLELARQGVVLLKNEGELLPLSDKKAKKIAVIGPNADDLYAQLGDYSPPVRSEQAVTVRQGLERLCGENCSVQYARGCGIFNGTDEELAKAVTLAEQSNLVILVLGGSSSRFSGSRFDSNGAALVDGPLEMDCGEGVDCADLRLCGRQEELFCRISALGKLIVTVLIGGRPYAIPEIAEHSTALLEVFYPGPMGGQAVAEILFGITEPGGRLPVSIPRSSGQLPVYYNSRNSYQAMHYHDLPDAPLYTFGDGLSYTEFVCENVCLQKEKIKLSELENKPITVSFTIRNIGKRAGWTVPSLYIHGLTGSVVRRRKELRAFDKRYVKPDECATVIMKLGFQQLAVWNASMHFAVEPGDTELILEDGGKILWKGSLHIQ